MEAVLGDLALAGVDFHLVDPDVRGAIRADVLEPTHLPFSSTPAAFCEMAAPAPESRAIQGSSDPTQCPFAWLGCAAGRKTLEGAGEGSFSGLPLIDPAPRLGG